MAEAVVCSDSMMTILPCEGGHHEVKLPYIIWKHKLWIWRVHVIHGTFENVKLKMTLHFLKMSAWGSDDSSHNIWLLLSSVCLWQWRLSANVHKWHSATPAQLVKVRCVRHSHVTSFSRLQEWMTSERKWMLCSLGTSTTQVLVKTLHIWHEATDKLDSYIRVVMLGFDKAFELSCTTYHILLQKTAMLDTDKFET